MYLPSPGSPDPASQTEGELYFSRVCRECVVHNPALYAQFSTLSLADFVKRTHLFNGRYENLYVDRVHLPEIETLLNFVLKQAAALLQMPETALKLGFWFNVMQPGQITSLHTHDDDDELLSGVYYLQVPENSGQLLLHPHQQDKITISPQEGLYVFFSPELPHEVTIHHGEAERISIAFNFGLKT